MCWIPALTIAFTFVPLKFRLLYVNCVQVAFGVWISKQANAPLHPVGGEPEAGKIELK